MLTWQLAPIPLLITGCCDLGIIYCKRSLGKNTDAHEPMLTNCRNVNLINISFVHHIEQMREVNWKIVIQSLIECSEQLGELRTSMDEERTKPDEEELTNLSWRSVCNTFLQIIKAALPIPAADAWWRSGWPPWRPPRCRGRWDSSRADAWAPAPGWAACQQ